MSPTPSGAKSARVLKSPRSRLVTTAGALTVAGSLLVGHAGGWEGLKLVAYKDVVGIWTACRGETDGIKRGMRFTREQCDVMFIDSLTKHEAGMRACLTAPDAIPERSYVSFVSVTYNIGTAGFCGSSMRRLLNAGNLRAACDALLAWNKGGKPLRVIAGLTNRRQDERRLCLEGAAGGMV